MNLNAFARDTPGVTVEFPISNAGMASAFETILRAVRDLGFPESASHRLAVILDELCSNMIRHDDTLTDADSFAVDIRRDGNVIVFTITDPGQPFNPFEHVHAEVPEIGGHGISLVKGLSCGVEYARKDGLNVVTVRIDPVI